MDCVRDLRSVWLIVAVGQLGGCGATGFTGARDEAYAAAVEANLDEDWETAAAGGLVYLGAATEDDSRFDRAQMLVAQALEELDLRYAAALYYADVAQARRNVELVDDALRGLERLVTSGPVDEEIVIRAFVASEDLSGLPPDLSDFVHFHRGVDSIRRGELEWAEQSFTHIRSDRPYYARAELVRAAFDISRGELDEALTRLEALLERGEEETPDLSVPEDVRVEAQLAVARIALDQERFSAAIRAYEELQDIAPRRPSLLLEMAWAHYYSGNYRRSLGLLVALDAPVYGGLIAPERYLLEAYNLRRLCQLDAARVAARRLQARHRGALGQLDEGTPPVESSWLRRAALQRPAIVELVRLTRRTLDERRRVEDLADAAGESGLPLLALYDWADRRLERRLSNAVDGEARRLGAELVGAADGVRLILHELSVQLLQGRSRPSGPPPRGTLSSVPSGEVSYEFGGEFWTDEIDDLEVVIEDRCLE